MLETRATHFPRHSLGMMFTPLPPHSGEHSPLLSWHDVYFALKSCYSREAVRQFTAGPAPGMYIYVYTYINKSLRLHQSHQLRRKHQHNRFPVLSVTSATAAVSQMIVTWVISVTSVYSNVSVSSASLTSSQAFPSRITPAMPGTTYTLAVAPATFVFY